jgi:hypothetical protein
MGGRVNEDVGAGRVFDHDVNELVHQVQRTKSPDV